MARKALSVFELTTIIKETLEEGFPDVLVEGEVSNYIDHSSGHIYFTIKDDKAQLSCTLWKWQRNILRFRPEDGMKVIVGGGLKVYEKGGRYQLNVQFLQPAGIGDLQFAFEQLKKKLAEEGLFDETRKKPIPLFPEVVGIVTSESGAALRDIVKVAWNRNPCVRLVLNHAQVQGDDAAKDIARAIKELNEWGKPDFIIVGRGGGSLEDLWAFNEEVVARAIAGSKIPIVSAVGHEIDFTIADFVADLRAPTPSAAVEMTFPSRDELILKVKGLTDAVAMQLKFTAESTRARLDRLAGSFVFTRPKSMIENFSQRLDDLDRLLFSSWTRRHEKLAARLSQAAARLELLSPMGVIGRGYSITRNNGRVVLRTEQLIVGDVIETVLNDGRVESQVLSINKN